MGNLKIKFQSNHNITWFKIKTVMLMVMNNHLHKIKTRRILLINQLTIP